MLAAFRSNKQKRFVAYSYYFKRNSIFTAKNVWNTINTNNLKAIRAIVWVKMQFQSTIFVVLFLWNRFHVTNQQHYDLPPSPCPHLFQYTYNGNNWIGEIELPSPPIQHHEVVLHVTLSLRAATTVRCCSMSPKWTQALTFKSAIKSRKRNQQYRYCVLFMGFNVNIDIWRRNQY